MATARATRREAKAGIGAYITLYNGARPHSSREGKTPDAAYFKSVEMRQRIERTFVAASANDVEFVTVKEWPVKPWRTQFREFSHTFYGRYYTVTAHAYAHADCTGGFTGHVARAEVTTRDSNNQYVIYTAEQTIVLQ